MSRTRTIKSQSRPAPAVASIGGVPTARRAINGSTRRKLITKPNTIKRNGKVEEIRFKGYQYLIDNSMDYTAKQINKLFDPDPADYPAEIRLRKNAVNDFMSFIKKNYFQKEATFGITEDGDLSADWRLKNTDVNIVFRGKKDITLSVIADELGFSDYIKLSSLLSVLKKHKVPTS